MTSGPILSVRYESVAHGPGRRRVPAVVGASFDIAPGETLGLVGESGCGKTTLARAIVGLPPPDSGSVRFDGTELTTLGRGEMRRARGDLQIVLQGPVSSLNPRRCVSQIVHEPIAVRQTGRSWTGWSRPGTAADGWASVHEALLAVGLNPGAIGDRYPAQLSRGQCQRVNLARALVTRPRLLICDEPVSALDPPVRAQILNLIEDLKARYGLSILLISHDAAVVRHVSDRAVVMRAGRVVATGDEGGGDVRQL